ncbi:MAG: hypothetical protein NTY14_08480 [Candidatus Omnitrophica bacterium]|nr:hypothetical protein [Candidatus Omnitrophota bacterium]
MNLFLAPIIVIFFVVMVVAVIFVTTRSPNSMKKKIKELGGDVNKKGAGVLIVGGKTLTIEYFPGSRNSSPWFKISTSGTFGSGLLIRWETSRDKFYKKIGLNQEVQVSDKAVDERLFFECDTPEFTKQIFLNPDVKPLVLKILSSFSSIEITEKTCTFTRSPSEPFNEISNEVIMDSARKLLAFVESIPRSDLGYHPEVSVFKTWKAALYFIGYGILVCGVVSFFWADFSFRVVDSLKLGLSSIGVNAVIFSAGSYFAFRRIKGFSTSSKVFIHFLFTFGIGILLLGRYGFAVANGIFDKTPAQKFEQVVMDKYTTTHKSSTTYHVVVAPWRLAIRPWGFTVGRAEYLGIVPGKTYYRIVTKPGQFGYEWVVSESLITTY